MAKVTILSMQKRMDRQGKKNAAIPALQVNQLTHTIMNQLTVVYLSCAKLRRSLAPESCSQRDSDIQIIESAVARIATQVETLRFRLEKTARARTHAKKQHTQIGFRRKLSLLSPCRIAKV